MNTFNDFIFKLNPPDYIQILGIVSSLLVSLVAIIISLITLRQNSKMIEESTRPYLSVYISHIYCTDCIDYLVLKNFGTSSAVITKFQCNTDLKIGAYDSRHTPFEHITGQNICPGEKFQTPLLLYKICACTDTLSFLIEYSSGKKTYTENITISLTSLADAPIMSANPEDKELEAISRSLQDICEKML